MSPFLSALPLALGLNPSAGDLKSYVRQLNARTAVAYKNHDSRFFDALFSPDFQARDERGVLQRRKQALFVVRFQLNAIKVLDYHATTQALTLQKAGGVVTTQVKMVGLTPARRGEPSQKVVITRRFSDQFQKRGNQWALVFRTELTAPIVKTTPLTNLVPARSKTRP